MALIVPLPTHQIGEKKVQSAYFLIHPQSIFLKFHCAMHEASPQLRQHALRFERFLQREARRLGQLVSATDPPDDPRVLIYK